MCSAGKQELRAWQLHYTTLLASCTYLYSSVNEPVSGAL